MARTGKAGADSRTQDGTTPSKASSKRRSSFRSAVGLLQAAYSHNDPKAMLDAYATASRNSIAFRIVASLIERTYPMRRFLVMISKIDRAIADRGLHHAFRQALDDLLGTWESSIVPESEPFLHQGPVIFFGNHPSLLTPFLLGAHIDREDLRYVSTSYLCRLMPEFGARSFPVEVPLTRLTTQLRRGGPKRVISHLLVSRLHRLPSNDEVRRRNRQSLAAAVAHVRNGGSLVICPDGGSKRPRHWHSGIGLIVDELKSSPMASQVWLVPFREEGSSNHRVYASLMRGITARLKRRWYARQTVRIAFADPLRLTEVAADTSLPKHTTRLLRTYYEVRFPAAAAKR